LIVEATPGAFYNMILKTASIYNHQSVPPAAKNPFEKGFLANGTSQNFLLIEGESRKKFDNFQ
jgi:hypothetical protein